MQQNIYKNIIIPLLYALPFAILYIISRLFLTDVYLFDWTAVNSYIYLWVVVIILAYFEHYYMATVLNVANIIGLFVGQFLGEYLRDKSIASITPDMDNGQIARAGNHHSVAIWIITILTITTLAYIYSIVSKTIKRRASNET